MDAIVGRLIREKSENLRRQAAINAELKMVQSTLESVFQQLHKLSPEQAAGTLEPIRKYFQIDALMELLKEREQVQAAIVDRIKQLRDLGVSD
jgi:hypothetical protein